jgi:hypothetical protein
MHPRDFFDSYWRTTIREEVFVAMSFEPEFRNTWKCAIEPAIHDATNGGLGANRVDTTILSGDTVLRILDGVGHSKLVFVDISIQKAGRWAGQRNGNVMYELGLAHAWRQSSEVVMVRCDNEPISFDVQSMFVHRYDSADLDGARVLFSNLISSALKEIDLTKSLQMEKAVQGLDHVLLEFLGQHAHMEYFAVNEFARPENVDFPVDTLRRDFFYMTSIHRLLEMGIIVMDVHAEEQRYAFHWSAFGKALCKRTGFLK